MSSPESFSVCETPTISEPFIVRAHHAQQLYNILGMGLDPDMVVDYAERSAATRTGKGYHLDVYGRTSEEAAAVKQSQSKFFYDFLTLPDDTTIRFVAGQKDSLCGSCVIGKHCETNSPKGDDAFLKTIGRLAREQKMENVLTEYEIIVPGWDNPSPILELPAWATKKILGDIDFHAQNRPRFARPIARLAVRLAIARAQSTHH